jgi:2-(1,2-epoxy-1,2-dihydrophenyl)acetyl-CoA isomerase
VSIVTTAIERTTGIATVTVNRPEALNAINVEVAQGIRDAFVPLLDEADLRAVILRGAGRAFMAGGDLAKFAEDFSIADQTADALLDPLDPAVQAMRALKAPVIACVHGAVAGAGLSLMGACDLVVAAEGTRFMLAYNRVAATPDAGGSWFLPRLLGTRLLTEMMLLDTALDTEAALKYGLVNRVVAADQLEQAARDMAVKIASGPTQAFGLFKRLIDTTFTQTLEQQLSDERDAFKACTRTDDFRAGVTAFLSKGKAEYSGK